MDLFKVSTDAIQDDLPRGQLGRGKFDSFRPLTFFEEPETLARIGFADGTDDNFLGVINATTKPVVHPNGRVEYITKGGVAVGNRDDRHRTLVAGSRSGKGCSCIIPTLLTYGGSVLTIDPKGENASITARYRATKLGQKVHILDPFKATAAHCDAYRNSFNPMSILTPDSMTLFEDAGLIADAIIVPSSSDQTHWDDSAKAFLIGLILYVLMDYKYSKKDLVTVADLLAGRILPFNELLQDMEENTSLDNYIVAVARSMREKADKERASVLSTARKNMQFILMDSMRDSLRDPDDMHARLELEDLKRSNISIYLVLPAMRMSVCAQWLRLFINLTLRAMEVCPVRPKQPVIAVLDEMAVLGRMKELEVAIGQIAGFGLRLFMVLQDLGQLKDLYGDKWETFLGNSGVLQFFGQADYFTSKWVSDYLDKTTITVTDVSSLSAQQKHTQGSTGVNQRQETLETMTAAEVRKYFARDDHLNRQLIIIPGRRPYILQRANYYQHELFAGRFDHWR